MNESDGQLDALPAGSVVAGYRIVEFVARGGQAFVYRGEAPDGRAVAIKECFYEGLASRSVDLSIQAGPPRDGYDHAWAMLSLHREAQYLQQAACGNLPAVVRCFDANGTTYLVMQWLEGEPLNVFMQRPVRYVLPQFMTAAHGLMDAVISLHVHGLAHLDIKAENVTVRPDRSLALLDLGATRSIDEQEDRSLTRLITERTAAPEQLGDDNLTLSADVYQLAWLFNEMIDALLEQSVAATLRDACGEILAKGMDQNPARRPADALALASALGWSDPFGIHRGVNAMLPTRHAPRAKDPGTRQLEQSFVQIPPGQFVDVALEASQYLVVIAGLVPCRISWRGAELCFYREGSRIRRAVPDGTAVRVGRDRNAEITMDAGAGQMSRRHLVLHASGNVVRVRDVSSLWTLVRVCER